FNVQDEWFKAMDKLKQDGKIRAIGVSVPDTTPDNVIGSLARERVDSIQVIYNIFEQYPEWNLFPVCEKEGTAVIIRVPFDEGALTGKYTADSTFAEGDVRNHYFRGNNLKAVVRKVEEIKAYKDLTFPGFSMADLALKFCLSHRAVSTVIPGIRNVSQADMNTQVSDGNYLNDDQKEDMKQFNWRKDFWFAEIEDLDK
ncbi:MAG: aldo/keto reductase, partial [Calditrichales bacterium]